MLSCFSHVQLFAALWFVAHQAPLSMGFSRQEYWIGLPFPSLGDLPNPGIEPTCPMAPCIAGGFFITVPLSEAPRIVKVVINGNWVDTHEFNEDTV